MNRHVVFGTGQIGRPLVEQLVARGHDVLAVNRSGAGNLPGARVVAGDAADAAFTRRTCEGAEVVYFCLNATSYARWSEEFPPLQRGVLAGAAASEARLVVLENLYSYGPPQGQPLVETMAAHPTSAKAATRTAMTEELLAAHRSGEVEVAIGRASDYFGPGATGSALGAQVFAAAVKGRTAQVMGDPDTPHSYSFTPDVASGLIALGASPVAAGQVWHLPVAETRTTREVIEQLYASAGHEPRILAAGKLTLLALGIFKPELRELRHTLYQFTDPWVVDDSRFREAFGELATPLDEALDSTLRWYAEQASRPVH